MDNRVCSMSSSIEPPFVQGKPGEIRGRKATGQASASWQVSRAAEGRLSALSVADREGNFRSGKAVEGGDHMARWLIALVLALLLAGHSVGAFAGAEGQDGPGHPGSGNSGGSVDHSRSHH